MFIMTEKEVQAELNKINTYLEKCMWLDFEFCRLNESEIVITGSVDLSYTNNYAIDIIFEETNFVQTLMSWSLDCDKNFIELCTEEETKNYYSKYKITPGNYIFKINVEDSNETQIYIAAKKIRTDIIIEKPF